MTENSDRMPKEPAPHRGAWASGGIATAVVGALAITAIGGMVPSNSALGEILIVAPDRPQPENEPPHLVSLEISFQDNSFTLTGQAKETLGLLAAAILTDELAGYGFVIESHVPSGLFTSTVANRLTQRRAESVREFLITAHGVEPARLTAVGKGFLAPLDPNQPEDSINERVAVSNVTPASP